MSVCVMEKRGRDVYAVKKKKKRAFPNLEKWLCKEYKL